MPPALAGPSNRSHDSPGPDLRPDAAGGPQFPVDQPHSAGGADAVHGLVQQIENPLGAGRLDRVLADVQRSRPVRGQEDRFNSLHDCFTRELKPGLRPSDPIPRSWSARATASSARSARSRTPSCSRSRARPIRCSIYSAIPAGGHAPQRTLHHAAADLEHVSPLSRAA